MVMPLMMSMYATNLGYDSVGTMFGANQTQMKMANEMTGGESQSQVASVAAQEKAILFSGISARNNYLASVASQGGADNLRKKNEEQKARMQASGVLFF